MLSPEKDLDDLLALLLLIVLEDIFNQELYSLARTGGKREPIKAIYTCRLKGMAWDLVEFMATQYSWTGKTGEVKVDFTRAFFDLVGTQLGYLKQLRAKFVVAKLFSETDGDEDSGKKKGGVKASDINTRTLKRELQHIADRDPQINDVYTQRTSSCTSLSPLLGGYECRFRTWVIKRIPEADRVPHSILPVEALVNLGACKRDREELELIHETLPPSFEPPYSSI